MAVTTPEIKEFQMGGSRKVTSALYSCGLLVVFIIIVLMIVNINFSESALPLVLLVPGLALVGFPLYWMVDEISGRLTIEPEQIIYTSVFKNRSILFSDIKGYRAFYDSNKSFSDGKVIVILSGRKNQKKIEVSKYVDDQPILLKWLAEHFTELTEKEVAEETKALMEPDAGESEQEREERFKKAGMVSFILNFLGGLAGGAVILIPRPHPVLLMAAITIVPLTFVAVYRSKGIIHFNYRASSPHPSLGLPTVLCGIGLLGRGIFDYDLIDYGQLWIFVLILFLILSFGFLAATSEFAKRTSMDIANSISFLLFLAMYSYGVYVVTNCVFDNGTPVKYKTTVTYKDTSRTGSHQTIQIIPIGPLTVSEINVDEKVFNAVQTNGTVEVYMNQGRWGTSWYIVKIGE